MQRGLTIRTPSSTSDVGQLPEADAVRRCRSIPEQIAEDIGITIIDGELDDGARILEEELAARYGVSRSSVREAIGLLERRGLLCSIPRKGTYVVGQSLDVIADLFNIRAVLIGLAGRYMARRRDPAAITELRECLGRLEAVARDENCPPLIVAQHGAMVAEIIIRRCGVPHLWQMLSEHADGSGWGLLWRRRSLDFQTAVRRIAYATDSKQVLVLIETGDDRATEQALRRIMFDSRDIVLQNMAALRGGTPDPLHALQDN